MREGLPPGALVHFHEIEGGYTVLREGGESEQDPPARHRAIGEDRR